MNPTESGDIWIVDDDVEDHDLIKEIFDKLERSNPLRFFESAEQLLDALDDADEAPFIIISDVKLPKMGGFELRERMLEIPNNKFHSVPFIFWSSQASEREIRKAYEIKAHGFFRKDFSLEAWKVSLKRIIDYWSSSLTPSKEDANDRIAV